ncbi:MAG: DUF3465 domain-containing protein [Phycisphaeraceae bacterium]|nr:DUF3465 domain-containing protein [Phycisphaeraceae bacterium]
MKPSQRQAAISFGYKLIAVLVAAALTIAVKRGWLPTPTLTPTTSSPTAPSSTDSSTAAPSSSAPPSQPQTTPYSRTVRDLYNAKRSDAWVETTGRVEKLLQDDTATSDNSDKHQKFLLLVPGDVTVLVAHNISTSQRVPVKPGDTISLRGEYEYSDKGGTIHFTHKPKYNARSAQGGWIEFKGVRYE